MRTDRNNEGTWCVRRKKCKFIKMSCIIMASRA